MNIYEEILKWSEDKPLWWRDALRRIIVNGNYTQTDLDEIIIAAKSMHGISQTGVVVPAFTPLDKTHLPSSSAATSSNVQLISIKDVKDINALAESQKLSYAQNGLTVIYGDNGSGKSGYVRILKNACRVRGVKPTILKNIYNLKGTNNPQATIEYLDNGTLSNLNWIKGGVASDKLQSVSIFDSQAAVHYVEKENEVAFRPFGLDVLDRLGEICLAIKNHIIKEQSNYSKATDLTLLFGSTAVGKLISSISKDTNKNDVGTLSLLSETDEKRYAQLKRDIAQVEVEDPKKKAIQIKSVVSGLETLKQHLTDVENIISKDIYAGIINKRQEYEVTQKAVEVATRELFKELPLEGVGTKTWIELWNAARQYSTEYAYKGEIFPNTQDDSLCVLCQQPLGKDARKRFVGFEDFVAGILQKKAEDIGLELSKSQVDYESLKVISNEIERILVDLESRNSEYGLQIKNYLLQAEEARIQTLQFLSKKDMGDISFPQIVDHKNLESLIQSLCEVSKEFDKLSNNDVLISIKQEFAELNARKELNKNKASVINEIDRLVILSKYKAFFDETNPQRISVQSKKMIEEVVIKQLSTDFLNELNVLGLHKLGLELIDTRGSSGVVFHQLQLSVDRSVKLVDILSEGEYKCISLAAFLSENCSTPAISGVVFDDPASSLDHIFRRKIADRIVKESLKRQVVVFTHDIVFMTFLSEAAQDLAATIQIQSLDYGNTVKGLPQNNPPWDAMTVKDRLGKLKNDLQDVDKIFKSEPRSIYEPNAREIYRKLRSTWERAVEETLLNGSITRFGRSIQTQRIKAIVDDVKKEDYEIIEKEMTKCSTYFGGHDQATELNDPVPNPAEIMKDIAILEGWRKDVLKRREKK